jgi:prephenate dehydrogenase
MGWEQDMKLGIIGVGAVGAPTAMAAVLRAHVREIVLVDKDTARRPRGRDRHGDPRRDGSAGAADQRYRSSGRS